MDYLLTSWRGMSEKASILAADVVGLPRLATGIRSIALDAMSRDQLPLITFGSYYVGAHNKAGFQNTNLIALEYDERQKPEVELALRRLGLRAVLVDTLCVDDDTCCVTALIPTDRNLTSDYFRAASLLTYDIGVGEMSNCWACTFIGVVNPEGDITEVDGDILEIEHRLAEGGYGKNENYLRRTLR